MIKNSFFLCAIFLLFSCQNIELVLKENNILNPLRNNTKIILGGIDNQKFTRELYSIFGNNIEGRFILETEFSEKKENVIVKKNQVAEKIDYTLSINYKVINKQIDCKVYENIIVTKFSYVPKSFGYNFGAERSLEKLYKGGIIKNIKTFIKSFPNNKTCKK